MAPVKISNTLRGTTPRHFGECVCVGSRDGKVSAGELRLQAGGEAPTREQREGQRVRVQKERGRDTAYSSSSPE